MNNNVKIAENLIRIAKKLIADNGNDKWELVDFEKLSKDESQSLIDYLNEYRVSDGDIFTFNGKEYKYKENRDGLEWEWELYLNQSTNKKRWAYVLTGNEAHPIELMEGEVMWKGNIPFLLVYKDMDDDDYDERLPKVGKRMISPEFIKKNLAISFAKQNGLDKYWV